MRSVVVATLMRPTGETGVQTHFNGFLSYLSLRGVSGTCVTPFSSPRGLVTPVFGARRIVHPISSTASVWWYRKWHGRFLRGALARVLRERRDPLVVYAQCPVSARAALEARRDPAQKVVMVAHFNVSQADEWAGKGYIRTDGHLYRSIVEFERRTLPVVDGIVYVSEYMRGQLEARIPELREVRAAIIPNFVDVPTSQPEPFESRSGLVCVGTLEPRKNQGYLIEIVKAASDAGHQYELTVIGDGPDRQRLERLARELGVVDQVHFLGFCADAAARVGNFHVLCHGARQENSPLAILEAMSRGLAVAAVPSGGIPEIVRDSVEGVFLPLDDPAAAADILIRTLEDQNALRSMGEAARQRVDGAFSAASVGARLLEFLDAA